MKRTVETNWGGKKHSNSCLLGGKNECINSHFYCNSTVMQLHLGGLEGKKDIPVYYIVFVAEKPQKQRDGYW